MHSIKLIGPFSEILTMRNLPERGKIQDNQLEIIKKGGIVTQKDKIIAIDEYTKLTKIYPQAVKEELTTEMVALPGFIDAHTHICSAGNRAGDYAMRLSGKSYLEIAEAGGGIWHTVTATRNASLEELSRQTTERANNLLEQGVTTCEVKSGYGLSVESELKMLEAIKHANEQTATDLISTCLAAHMKPKDFKGTATAYLEIMAKNLLPSVWEKGLAHRVDAFIEKSAFSVDEATPYLQKAKEIGFEVTIHADQFTVGGSQLATTLDAISADHLEASSNQEVELLAQSNVIATALPGASIGLGDHFTPARKLLDKGGRLAIASDWNPGSAPMGKLLTQAAILGTYQKLTMAETLTALTERAAKALNLKDRGILDQDKIADIIAFPCNDFREILYRQGAISPIKVWKKGISIFNNSK